MTLFFTLFINLLIFIFAVIGYVSVGFVVSLFCESLSERIICLYMDYLILRYPKRYYKDSEGYYWVKDCDYCSHSMSSDKKVEHFRDVIYTLFFILWPISFMYKIIIKIKNHVGSKKS